MSLTGVCVMINFALSSSSLQAEAKDICLTLDQTFETVHKNMQLQQNLTSDLR